MRFTKMYVALLLIVGLIHSEYFILTPVNSKTGYSDIIPLKDAKKIPVHLNVQRKGVIDTVFYYDPNATAYIYSGIDVGDTMVEWFKSVAACSLIAAYIDVYNYQTDNSQVYWFISAVPDSLVPVFDSTWHYGIGHHWFDYHFGASYNLLPGPSPIACDSIHVSNTENLSGQGNVFELGTDLMPPIDVGTKPFLVGFTPLTQGTGGSAEPWALISAGSEGNNYGYHALVYQQDFGSSFPGASPGWYSNWHTYWAYAIVDIYENPVPLINSVTKLSWTYDLDGPFTIQANLNDFGVPSDSSGVAYVELKVWVGSNATDTLHIPMTLVNGDSTNGVWQAVYSPSTALNVGDTVFYTVWARDYQGAVASFGRTYSFSTLRQTTNQILYVLDNGAATRGRDVYFVSVFQALGYQVDVYDAVHWGAPDASVLLGQGGYSQRYQVIFWNGLGSRGFAADTLLISQYLDGGGKLVISDENLVVGGFGIGRYGTWTNIPAGSFLKHYLKISSVFDDYIGTSPNDGGYTPNSDTVISLIGESTNPVGRAFLNDSITLYPYGGYNWIGAVINDGQASDAFYFPDGTPAGFTYDGNYKLAVLYWPITYLVDSVEYDNNGMISYYSYDSYRTDRLIEALLSFMIPPTVNDTISVVSSSACPGDSVIIPIVLKHVETLSGFQSTMIFDRNLLHFQNIYLNPIFSGNFLLSSNVVNDTIKFLVVSFSGDTIPSGIDTVLFVKFLVDSNATIGDSTLLLLLNSVASNPSANNVSLQSMPGWVYFEGIKGDLNQDGSVDVSDVVRVINIILGIPPAPTQYELWAADYDGDRHVDIIDVVGIINQILGRSKSLDRIPVVGNVDIWVQDNKIFLTNDIEIGGIQFDLMGNIDNLKTISRSINMEFFISDISGGKRIILTSLKGDCIPIGRGEILSFEGDGYLKNILIAGKNGEKIGIKHSSDFYVKSNGPNIIIREGMLNFNVNIPNDGELKVNLIDVSGRILVQRRFKVSRGSRRIKFKLENVKDGVYFIVFKFRYYRLIKKIVVKREL